MEFVLLLVLFTVFSEVSLAGSHLETLPSYVNVCNRDDPESATCLKKSINSILPFLKNGSMEFDLEPIDPLTFRDLVFKYDSVLLGGSITIPNAEVTGLSNITVLDVRPDFSDPKKFILSFDAYLPLMNIKADYKLVGNVIQISTKMNGRVHFSLENVTLTYGVEGNIEEREGRDYIALQKFIWRMNGEGIQGLTLLNRDVVHGRPALNRIVRTVMKSSWRILKDNMLPKLLPETDKLLTKMFKNFFSKYPYDVLLPKLPEKEETTDPTTEMEILEE